MASNEVKKIVEEIKRKTAMIAYKLEILKDSQPTIFDSKFGGLSYWDMKQEYPTSSSGKKLILLAQINLTRANLEDERLPKQGMLQFFIDGSDEIYGSDFDEPTSQKDFRVIYHEHIDTSVTREQVKSLGIIDISEEGPVFKEVAIEIKKTTTYMGTDCVDFDEIFDETVKELTGEDIEGQSPYEYFDKEDDEYLHEELDALGHWMLGYPFFTQYDPREDSSYYDTLLFQMDSEMIDGEDYVLWGDCGVANFFINSKALAKKDFSNVWYNWDCC